MSKVRFPTSFTVLFGLIAITCVLTWILPAGKYETHYNSELKQSVPRPGTYEVVESNPQNLFDLFQAPIGGFYDPETNQARAIDVALFVLFIGGFLGVVNKTGAINSAIQSAMQTLAGKEIWIIPFLMGIFSLSGTVYGMAEETLPFYVLLLPIVLSAGFDTVTAVAIILLGSGVGTLGSTINPFATVIASNAAGVKFTDGIEHRLFILIGCWLLAVIYTMCYARKVQKDAKNSLVHSTMREDKRYFLQNFSKGQKYEFTTLHKVTLLIFISTFVLMIIGVTMWSWWMHNMSALFLMSSITVAIINKFSEQDFVDTFIEGAKDLLSVALIIGFARGIVVVLEHSNISATILHYAENGIYGLNSYAFIVSIFGCLLLLSVIVPSSSALAVLAVPIVAPLADFSNVDRTLVVTAYQASNGLINLINPAFAVVAGGITISRVPLNKWLRFMAPLFSIFFIYILLILLYLS